MDLPLPSESRWCDSFLCRDFCDSSTGNLPLCRRVHDAMAECLVNVLFGQAGFRIVGKQRKRFIRSILTRILGNSFKQVWAGNGLLSNTSLK
jgi:hypothetical protein